MISTRVCKKIFLIKAKKNFVLGVSKFRTKTFIFEYFPKIPSEMNSKHPFYSILIPMTSHAKIFILVVGGPKGVPEPKKKFLWYLKIISTRVCKKIFLIKAKKLFCTWCPKSAVHPRTQNFWNFFFHRGIRKKILHMITNFEVWVAWRFFE